MSESVAIYLILTVLLPNVSRISLMYLLLWVFQLGHGYAMAAQQTATLQQYAADQKQHVEDLRCQHRYVKAKLLFY